MEAKREYDRMINDYNYYIWSDQYEDRVEDGFSGCGCDFDGRLELAKQRGILV